MSAWTFIAQRATTGEWLDWDLPLKLDSLEWTLSGPGSLVGTVSPDVGGLRAADGRLLLEEWGTILYAESGDEIRGGFIVVSSSFEGDVWKVEAAGYSSYPHAVTYDGEYSETDIDPAAVFAHIWQHLQSFPDSDLGVTITGSSTSARLGTAEEPYTLAWWDAPYCGEELDSLAKTTPFDYVERHRWTSPEKEAVVHEIEIGYPRLGRRREDLLFSQGDNVIDVVTVESNGDDFANHIMGRGAGEGSAMLRRETGIRDGRLRRVAVYSDKSVTDTARMDALIADELAARKAALRITELKVTEHPNAPIGSWQLGDDVPVRMELPWLGELEMWVRITAWSLTSETTAKLTVARSDLFRYGG